MLAGIGKSVVSGDADSRGQINQESLLPQSYAPLPEAITSFGAVVADGWLYVYGGNTGERHHYSTATVSQSFYRLNLVDGVTWETLPSDSPAQGASLIAYQGTIYRVGGMQAWNRVGEKWDLYSLSQFARFDPATRTWSQLASMPEGRSHHDAVIVNNILYVGGGWNLSGTPDDARFPETVLWIDLSQPALHWESIDQPFQRRGLALAAVDSRIYFIGGIDPAGKTSVAVDVYEPTTQRRSRGPALPDGQWQGFGVAACTSGGQLYVSGMSGRVLKLAETGDRWQTLGTLRQPRIFHRLLANGGKQLLAIGGETVAGEVRDIEAFLLNDLLLTFD